jgi:hypothetical protein
VQMTRESSLSTLPRQANMRTKAMISGPIRYTLPVLVVALAMAVSAPPTACARQASGSLLLVPSNQHIGPPGSNFGADKVSLAVFVRNTSTTALGEASPATLHGPISIALSLFPSSNRQDPGVLDFMGCDLAGAQAVGCSGGVPDQVMINLDPAGLPLPATDAPQLLATIRLANTLGRAQNLELRASTSACALESCVDQTSRTNCSRSSANGVTQLHIDSVAPSGRGCESQCQASITFRKSGPDILKVKGTVSLASAYDPTTEPFKLALVKGSGIPDVTHIYDLSGLLLSAPRGFSYPFPSGVVRLSPLKDGSFLVEVSILGDFRGADTAVMKLGIDLGSNHFSDFVNSWRPRPGGGWVGRF